MTSSATSTPTSTRWKATVFVRPTARLRHALRTVLRAPGVARWTTSAISPNASTWKSPNTQLTRLGISPQQLAEAINSQNAVTHAGTLTTEDDRIFVRPSGQFDDARALGDTLIRVNDKSIRLGDIAEIRRGYQDPPVDQMRLAGKPVLGIGITMQPGRTWCTWAARWPPDLAS